MLQVKNEAAAFAERKQDSSCQALKGKKEQINYSITNF